MEVEEDADTEREDLKAREARKKVVADIFTDTLYSDLYVCTIVYLGEDQLLLIATHSKYKLFLILPDSLKESLPHHHLEQFNHLLLLRTMIQKVLTISVI